MTDVLLIYPRTGWDIAGVTTRLPLALLYIGSYLQSQGFSVQIIEQRVGRKGLGFGAEVRGKAERDESDFYSQVMPEDLLKFGLIPEFIGRLPVITTVSPLDRAALVEILTEPRNALVKQYQRLFEMDGVELEFADDDHIDQRVVEHLFG